jgi:hypothetical protein
VLNHAIASVKQRKLPSAEPEDEAGIGARRGGAPVRLSSLLTRELEPSNVSSRDSEFASVANGKRGRLNQPNRHVCDPYARGVGGYGREATPIPIGRRRDNCDWRGTL